MKHQILNTTAVMLTTLTECQLVAFLGLCLGIKSLLELEFLAFCNDNGLPKHEASFLLITNVTYEKEGRSL